MIETLIGLDRDLFLFLNGLHTDSLDQIMIWISDKFVWVPFYILLIVLMIRKHEWRSMIIIVPALILLITLSDQISVQVFKNGFERLRPCHNEDISNLIHLIGNCGGKYGFISSHATNTFALATFVIFIMQSKPFLYGMLIWAAVVSYSRIYLGVHYPADVFVGATVGCTIGFGVWSIVKMVNVRMNYLLSYE